MSTLQSTHSTHTNSQKLFYALLQLGIGTRNDLPLKQPVSADAWKEIVSMARKQAVSGILMDGILKLPPEFMPPTPIKLKEIQYLLRMEQLNLRLNQGAVQVSEYLKRDGFACTILKVQGIARYYPNPLHRTPGDIDVWPDGTPQEIRKYGMHKFPEEEFRSHHVDFPILKEIEVELHFQPAEMSNPITNRRFLDFCETHRKSCASNMVLLEETNQQIAVATDAFNRIYILQHIMRHLFEEGIGLRQLMDYCLVLRKGMTQEEKNLTIQELDRLNMKGFAQAVMYILQTVFALEEPFLILPPDDIKGKLLLEEILEGGNFGHHDQRFDKNKMKNMGYKFLKRIQKNIRLIKLAPSEALATIGYLPYVFFYRRFYKLYWKFQQQKKQ